MHRARGPHNTRPLPACPRALQLVPWATLAAVVLAIPLRRAVLVQAAVLACLVAGSGAQRRLSAALCAQAPAHYQQAVDALALALACLVPGGEAAAGWRLGWPAAFHLVNLYLSLVVTFGLTLALLYRGEWRRRLAFARQHRLAPEAAALQRRRQQWGGGGVALLGAGAAPWLACLTCHAAQRLGWIPNQ